MNHLIRAELLKLRTTRMLWLNAVAALAFVPLSRRHRILAAGHPERDRHSTERGLPQRHLGRVVRGADDPHAGRPGHGGRVPPQHGHLDVPHHPGPQPGRAAPSWSPPPSSASSSPLRRPALTLAIALPWLAGEDVDVGRPQRRHRACCSAASRRPPCAPWSVSASARWCGTRRRPSPSHSCGCWPSKALLVSFGPTSGAGCPAAPPRALTGVATANGGLLPMWGGALLLPAYGLAFAAAGTRFVLQRDVA